MVEVDGFEASNTSFEVFCKLVFSKIVQERLGHSSIQLILDTYSHVAPGLQAKAAEALDSIFVANKIYTKHIVEQPDS